MSLSKSGSWTGDGVGGVLLKVAPSPEALPYAPYVFDFCLMILVHL